MKRYLLAITRIALLLAQRAKCAMQKAYRLDDRNKCAELLMNIQVFGKTLLAIKKC